MSFQRHAEYKDSSVEWLGDVPSHWAVLPCRAVAKERTGRNDRAECENYLSLMANIGVIPYADKGDVGNKKPDDLSKCKMVVRGDLVINSMNYGIGSYGLSRYDGICSPVYIVLTPRGDVIEPRFALRVFENRAFQTFAQSFGNGILEHRCAINWDILKGIGIALPSREEQRTILGFLDRETTKIDALVAEQEKLIALLKEKRQALISHAVTQGLDPSAPMKDSGIEWLGQIPAHWDVLPLKRDLRFLTSGSRGWADHYSDEGALFIRIGNLTRDSIELDLTDTQSVDIPVGIEGERTRVFPGDVLFSITADLGSVAVAPEDLSLAYVSQHVALARLSRRKLKPRWLAYVAMSDLGKNYFQARAYGGTKIQLSLDDIANLSTTMPPFSEQSEITAHLDAESRKLRELIVEAHRTIALLKERRSALISAAVTGKIDVRGFTS